jgi:hypothetical protein
MSDERQFVDSKGVSSPSNCPLPFNNLLLFVIPTGANPDFLQRRKSGVAEGRDPQCAIRVPHIYRSAPLSPLSTPGNRTHRTLISEHEELAASRNPKQQFHSRFSSICTSSAHRRRPQY